MIVFLRHAQRGDNQIPSKLSQIEYDPPIIEASEATILKTSQQLAQIFTSNGIKNFKITTSKFLRCIMTARKLQQNLQKMGFVMNADHYEIDDRISEYMREDWFAEYPLNSLIYHTEHKNKYFEDVPFREKVQQKKQFPFPQNYIKFHHRVMNFKEQLKYPSKDQALLVVTHGFVVRQLCFTMNQMPKYQNEIKYCGYAAYMQGKHGQILIRSKL